MILAIVAVLYWNFYPREPSIEPASIEPEQAPALSEEVKAKKTIAVLPFTDLSPEKDQEYFVDGLSEEIINCLAQIPNLGVTGRTSSFTFKGSNKKTQEIANELGVENILEGSVRKAGNSLRITAQLIRAADDLHLWSKTYDRELKDIFAVQEEIATAVADELKVKLRISTSLKQLGGTENVAAYEHYLVAKGLIGKGSSANSTSAILEQESIDTAIALDPGFALAWAYQARLHNWWGLSRPANLAASELDAGINAALKAIELEPNLAAGYYWLGIIKTASRDFLGGESAFRKALELTTEPFWESSVTIVIHYWSVGYIKKAHEIIKESRISDPLNSNNSWIYITSLSFIGDTQQAEDEYKRVKALVVENRWEDKSAITNIRVLNRHIVFRDDIIYSNQIFDTAKNYLASPEKALSELRRLYSDKDISFQDLMSISMWAAYFGNPDFSTEVMEKCVNINATSMYYCWWPVFQEVRQLPRFKALVKKIGLVDYWEQFGWPDFCQPTDDGDFECE